MFLKKVQWIRFARAVHYLLARTLYFIRDKTTSEIIIFKAQVHTITRSYTRISVFFSNEIIIIIMRMIMYAANLQ